MKDKQKKIFLNFVFFSFIIAIINNDDSKSIQLYLYHIKN